MGNRLHEMNEKIERDKMSKYDHRFANEFQKQSPQPSQVQDRNENGGLNLWQKLIYRDQQSIDHANQANIDHSNQPIINIKREQGIKKEQGSREKQYNELRGGSQWNGIREHARQWNGIRENATQDIQYFQDIEANKFVFTGQMQRLSQRKKLNWKKLTQLKQPQSCHNYSYSQLNSLAHNQRTKNKQIYYSWHKQQIIQTSEHPSVVIVQKVQINESQLMSHITHNDMFIVRDTNDNMGQKIGRMKKVNELIYKWRMFVSKMALTHNDNSFPIVGMYDISTTRFNISFQSKTTIYHQLILYRINQIRNLTHLQGIYVLQQCLIGFKMLYDIFGYFLIEESMIGFNSQGKVKAWISPYYWSNLCYSVGSHDKSLLASQHRQFVIHKQYDEQDMVGRVWMIVQKYSLFHQSIVMESGGFRNCGFGQALQMLVRHKSSIIDRRDKSLGLVRFVDRLEFNSWGNKQVGIMVDKYFQDRPIQLMRETPHESHQNAQNLTQFREQKPLNLKPTINLWTRSTHQQSHIKVLPKTSNPQSIENPYAHNRRRAPIFDKGYNHTMTNNIDQTYSMIQSQNVNKQNYRSNNSLFPDRNQLSEHVRFINIRSVK